MIFINNNYLRRPSLLQIVIGFLMLFVFLYVGFYITKWILYGLAFLSPLLIVAAALLNFQTIRNFFRYLWGLFRVKPLWWIVVALIMLVGFPVTAALLFVRAWSQYRKRKNYETYMTSDGSEYIDYEVVDERRTRIRRLDIFEGGE